MLDRFTTYFLQICDNERHQILLWIVVCFLGGIVFSYSYYHQASWQIIAALMLAAVAAILLYANRFSYRAVCYWLCLFFLLGFSWMRFYQTHVVLNRQITGKVYGQVEGTISEIHYYAKSATLIIDNPTIYQAQSNAAKKKTKKKSKSRKISAKQIEKTFLNIDDLQAINRQKTPAQAFQNVRWRQEGDRKIFPNPPHKISLHIRNQPDLAMGDKISLRAFLEPPKQKEFINGFDQSLYAATRKIGAYGRVLGEVTIIEKKQDSLINQWRTKIAQQIDAHLSGDVAGTAKALLIGQRNAISQEQLVKIRQSGLAHLLAISGLHMSIMAAIFFTAIRFMLVRITWVSFDSKKLSALIAMLGCYLYLELAGSPVSAMRSFVMVALVLTAMMLDRKADLKRSIALAAFVLLVINPYHAFMVSFWLSFAAILSLACFHQFISRFKPEDVAISLPIKFAWYFAEIMLASIIVQIATAPFLIFAFHEVSILGIFANMFAIPLVTFFAMPLGFMSLLAMPFGLEKLPLQCMGFAIEQILYLSYFIANFSFAYFENLQMPPYAFALAVASWLMISLLNSKIKWFVAPVFMLSFMPLFFTKYPDISFDGQQKFFAIYNEKDGLVFSKKLRKSHKRDLWMKEFQQDEFHYFDANQCDDKKCIITNNSGKILILLGRNNIKDICQIQADLIVNLNNNYALPSCFDASKTIDNEQFEQKGSHFIYYTRSGFKIKTAR